MKYTCIKQHDITDCAAACLTIISRQYGLKLPISRIREIAGTDKMGTNAYGVVQGPVMDVEILLPLDREIAPPEGYVWKPRFLLTNAVVVRHIGSPATMQQSANAINAYIMEHHFTPITAGYNVTVKDAKTPKELDDMVVDIYVGVSPNVL